METKDALDQLEAPGNLNEKLRFCEKQLAQKLEGFLEFYNEQKRPWKNLKKSPFNKLKTTRAKPGD